MSSQNTVTTNLITGMADFCLYLWIWTACCTTQNQSSHSSEKWLIIVKEEERELVMGWGGRWLTNYSFTRKSTKTPETHQRIVSRLRHIGISCFLRENHLPWDLIACLKLLFDYMTFSTSDSTLIQSGLLGSIRNKNLPCLTIDSQFSVILVLYKDKNNMYPFIGKLAVFVVGKMCERSKVWESIYYRFKIHVQVVSLSQKSSKAGRWWRRTMINQEAQRKSCSYHQPRSQRSALERKLTLTSLLPSCVTVTSWLQI